jgi:hypothetical protein
VVVAPLGVEVSLERYCVDISTGEISDQFEISEGDARIYLYIE